MSTILCSCRALRPVLGLAPREPFSGPLLVLIVRSREPADRSLGLLLSAATADNDRGWGRSTPSGPGRPTTPILGRHALLIIERAARRTPVFGVGHPAPGVLIRDRAPHRAAREVATAHHRVRPMAQAVDHRRIRAITDRSSDTHPPVIDHLHPDRTSRQQTPDELPIRNQPRLDRQISVALINAVPLPGASTSPQTTTAPSSRRTTPSPPGKLTRTTGTPPLTSWTLGARRRASRAPRRPSRARPASGRRARSHDRRSPAPAIAARSPAASLRLPPHGRDRTPAARRGRGRYGLVSKLLVTRISRPPRTEEKSAPARDLDGVHAPADGDGGGRQSKREGGRPCR